ncbi:ABC transporter substrate-binding protein [Amycolatopsis magusensis]|uniref:ABC transporter substrate-binding protein n=1 Tax=Amycolatopsis magusensis TaxID=882444 RepID=UPI003C2F915E
MKRAIALALVLLSAAGCAPAPATAPAGANTVQDCQGKDVTIPEPPRRVVALDGWAAQSLVRLGLGDRIVGVGFTGPLTAESEPFRGELAKIPVLAAKSIPVTEVVAAQSPDAVVTAFSSFGGAPGTAKDADLATMGAVGVAACQPRQAGELSVTYDFLTKLGRVFGVPERAERLIGELRGRETAVADRTAAAPKPRVLALADNPVAGQPVKSLGGGTIGNALIRLGGGTNIFAGVTAMHADVSPEKVIEADPEVIWVVSDFSFASTTGPELVAQVKANPLLATTTAAKQGRILSSSQYLVGFPTPLNLDGLEQLAAGLHPVAK